MCIEHHGSSCSYLWVQLEAMYGEIVKDYIHVHHLRSLSKIGGEYVVLCRIYGSLSLAAMPLAVAPGVRSRRGKDISPRTDPPN